MSPLVNEIPETTPMNLLVIFPMRPLVFFAEGAENVEVLATEKYYLIIIKIYVTRFEKVEASEKKI